jgi:membrane protease YdiL (CAAX protease family)
MLASLVVLAWPVLRGVPWRRTCREIGWQAGDGPIVEGLYGLGCYVATLPLLGVGLVLTLVLLQLRHRFGAPLDPFGPSDAPTHPIVESVVHGGWPVRLLVLLLASGVAPLVEETMFRGVLYRHLRDVSARWARWASVLGSALVASFLFAAIHPQGLVAVPALMALALGFTLAREWRGTLVPAMVAHGVNNGLLMLLLLALAG